MPWYLGGRMRVGGVRRGFRLRLALDWKIFKALPVMQE